MQVRSCKLSYETARALQKWLIEIALQVILVLSLVQFKMVSMRSEIPYALHPISQKFPQRCLRNGSKVRLIDDGPLSSFQGRSSSASSFHASLLQAINGVMSLALCPQVVSQASQHFSDLPKSKALVRVALPASLSAQSFPFTPACPGQYTHRRFGPHN